MFSELVLNAGPLSYVSNLFSFFIFSQDLTKLLNCTGLAQAFYSLISASQSVGILDVQACTIMLVWFCKFDFWFPVMVFNFLLILVFPKGQNEF